MQINKTKIFVTLKLIYVALNLIEPACIGMCILELSKVLMYKFYYDYIKSNFDSKSKLLFTDTDSFIYEIKIENVYEDCSSNKGLIKFKSFANLNNFSYLIFEPNIF